MFRKKQAYYFLDPVAYFPNAPRSVNCTCTFSSPFFHMALPTRSSGDRVAATPSLSHLALTIKSSCFHQRRSSLLANSRDSCRCGAPSTVKSRGLDSDQSRGKLGFSILAAKTGGGFPLDPFKIAAGTLSGLSGRHVK
jgi:hypothetical protein